MTGHSLQSNGNVAIAFTDMHKRRNTAGKRGWGWWAGTNVDRI